MGISDSLRRDADSIWRRIMEHPFVIELYSGDLPIEKFKYYIIQDYNYLITMYRCLSLISSKLDIEAARETLYIAYLDASVELDNYRKLISRLGLDMDTVLSTEPAPTNEAYMNFLLANCSLSPAIYGLVAILPCFWSYREIAEYHRDKLLSNDNDIYREWGEAYLTDDYKSMVERLKDLVDLHGEDARYDELKRLFILGSRYEYMFWDMAYRMESWPI